MIYLIGIPGLIPFYLCFYNIDLIFLDFDKNMFIHYSTVILSFLGAVYWGIYLQSKNNIAILFSVCPAIYAFLVLSFAFEARVFTTIQTFSRFLETCLSIINLSSSLNPELYEIYNNAVILFIYIKFL